jgi:prepilin-type processing-associated H-X9-DG protein
MLLPALNKARQAAKTVVCLSNLRQLGQAFQMYTNQYNNTFPPFQNPAAQHGPSSSYDFWPGLLVQDGFVKNFRIYTCPSLPSIYPPFGNLGLSSVDVAADSAWEYVHYGYNYTYIGSSIRQTPSSLIPAKRNQIHQPTQTILLVDDICLGSLPSYDGGNSRGYYFAYDNGVYPGYETADPRHDGGHAINVLWVDGHASTLQLNSQDVGKNPPNPAKTLTIVGDDPCYWDRN